MRLCSAEGVLQPATCSKTQKGSQRDSGRTSCQWIYKGRGPPGPSLPPEKALLDRPLCLGWAKCYC